MRIVIVEDDIGFVEEVEKTIRDFHADKREAVESRHLESTTLLEELKGQKSYDIYLFDVEMPGMSGLELAAKVRFLDTNARIVFLTSYEKYALQSIRTGAYYYILKDSYQKELRMILERIRREEEEQKADYYVILTKTHGYKVRMDHILYVTKEKKYAFFQCLNGGVYMERDSLEKIYSRLPRERFLMIERGIIVNMKHIMQFEHLKATMRNGDILPVGRNLNGVVKDRPRNTTVERVNIMKLKAMKWAFGLAWYLDKKLLILCSVILSAVSVLPAVALTYRQDILAALNAFLETGEGSMEAVFPTILLLGMVTALIGISNRLNTEFVYSIMFDSYYFGMEEILMDCVQSYSMEELLQKETNDEYHACVLREGALTDFICCFCSLLGKFVGLFSLLLVAFSVSKWVFFITAVYIAGIMCLNLNFTERMRDYWKEIRDKERLAEYYESMPAEPDCAREMRIFESKEMILRNWREAYGAVFEHGRKYNLAVELRTFISGFGLYLFLVVMIVYSLFELAEGNMQVDVLLVIFTLCMNVFMAVSGVAKTLISADYGLCALERQYRIFGSRIECGEQSGENREAEEQEAETGETTAPGQWDREDNSPEQWNHRDNSQGHRTGKTTARDNGSREVSDLEKETDRRKSPPVFRTENLCFSYRDNRPALEDVSVFVEKVEVVALVGLNGSGKSTLVKLFLQLYRPSAGAISYLGRDYESLEKGFLGGKVGTFFQDYYLFHFPVWENIGFGDIEHVDDRERIEKALEKGQARNFVRNLPFGTETYIHRTAVKEGVEFSGGESQKLAVARAYMSDRDILIFDEPASMLDPISEMEQFENIRDTVRGRTAILISHRIGFARLADKIILLDKGKVAEVGSHEELIAAGGLYAKLFQEQAQWYRQEED